MRSLLLLLVLCSAASAQTAEDAKKSLLHAVKFFHQSVATHGGYVYKYSADLKLREAEGVPDKDTIWIQPPGTPLVGEALLAAYKATGDQSCLQAATDAAHALSRGQLQSGGWYYSATFGKPAPFHRRDDNGKLQNDPTPVNERTAAGGWKLWKQRKFTANLSTFDDDVTFAALRFIMRIDAALNFKDAEIHEAALYGAQALLGVQFPNGAYATNFDRFPNVSPDEKLYPVLRASYPNSWPRTWPKDFTGCYVTNDELMSRAIDTLLLAYTTYKEPKYLDAARRAGDFLILAQLPEPQPAWAQQYDEKMQPVWCRAFEVAAITSRESEGILRALLSLYRATNDKKYLAPIPPALAYLRRSVRPDGTLARFYELQTNKPLYFTRGPGGAGHILTYSDKNPASNYGFIIKPEMDAIEADYQAALAGKELPKATPDKADINRIITNQDTRGAWLEPGTVRDAAGHKQTSKEGIISSATFSQNAQALCRFLQNQP